MLGFPLLYFKHEATDVPTFWLLLYLQVGAASWLLKGAIMGGCQNYGRLLLGTLNIRCRTILGTQKGTMILTITHIKIL